MKNSIDTMKEIIETTYRQIEDNLPPEEYLISRLTVYDKNNGVSTNIFLTNQAIFLQESEDLEKIKKRRFEKINDIKLTSNEIYIEFINGYKIVGDVSKNFEDAQRFFNCIKSNTKIRTSSSQELQNANIEVETPQIIRENQFTRKENVEAVRHNYVEELTPNYFPEETKIKKKKNIKKIIIITLVVLLTVGLTTVGIIFGTKMSQENKAKKEEEAKISAVQARADELLKYQLANNAFFDYIFELQSSYDDITTDLSSLNLNEISNTLNDYKKEFKQKYSDDFNSSSNVKAIYDVSKINEWMNSNKTSVADVFDLFEDCLDTNFKNETKVLSLKKKLTDADGEIRKVQTILAEEKEAVKKALAEMTGETYTPPSTTQTKTQDKIYDDLNTDGDDNNSLLINEDDDSKNINKESKDDSTTNNNTSNDSSNTSTNANTTNSSTTKETIKKITTDDDGFTDEQSAKNSAKEEAVRQANTGRSQEAAYQG